MHTSTEQLTIDVVNIERQLSLRRIASFENLTIVKPVASRKILPNKVEISLI